MIYYNLVHQCVWKNCLNTNKPVNLRWWELLDCGNDAFKSVTVCICVSYIYTVTYNVFNEFNYHVAKTLEIRFKKHFTYLSRTRNWFLKYKGLRSKCNPCFGIPADDLNNITRNMTVHIFWNVFFLPHPLKEK